ncbi:DUF2330 domain-containing protein [Streptomyces sp. ME19-01-6]|uniref:DUF2330 domain-containing protein n=1 Tax=Streptomyces sp. ME19-01-6 TaxID=3028686 RepID=UPI0029AF74AB|nr:DUF2330 domain-containing protein [Streptomyces sp. ME19-01-6]MDX3225643.1 DUF2330 domain-containing protein [Streptomyces sp. ME19-01-6]
MSRPVWRRTGLVLLALVSLQLGTLVWPAYACGCGGLVPGRNTTVAVAREASVVRWDGRTEEIVMSLTVGGDAHEAAWIMPVPHRATVRLGNRALFDEVREVTAPVHRTRHYFWPRPGDWPFDDRKVGYVDGAGAPDGAGAKAPPRVGVVSRERLGPFDVARLTATDPGALRDWLKEHGFQLPDRLAEGLKPYVRAKWEYVAVRLAPAADARGEDAKEVLGGTLDPLRLTFDSNRLVYPMRLSRLAKTPQNLELYVLAPHRMEPRGDIGGGAPRVTYAGWFTPGQAPLGDLAELAGRRMFLTGFEQSFPRPELINGDHELRRAEKDGTYQRVTYDHKLLTIGGIPAWLLTVGGGLLAVVAAALTLLTAVRRRRRGRGALFMTSP